MRCRAAMPVAGVDRLERRPALDRAALARARRLAELPHGRRLADRRPIEADLREAGVPRFATARTRVELKAGATDPIRAFGASWADAGRPWREALDPAQPRHGATRLLRTPDRGFHDPVRRAVDGWLGSAAHRRAMLDRDFTRTGMGVVVDEAGEVWFTQLFLEPRERGR